MSKKTTDQKTEKQAGAKKPVDLTDNELERAAAGWATTDESLRGAVRKGADAIVILDQDGQTE